jgi:hypothetical protein
MLIVGPHSFACPLGFRKRYIIDGDILDPFIGYGESAPCPNAGSVKLRKAIANMVLLMIVSSLFFVN